MLELFDNGEEEEEDEEEAAAAAIAAAAAANSDGLAKSAIVASGLLAARPLKLEELALF